ncbi:hypothetical protein U0C82_03695 [Fulvimarina sp. 2208YS6-2-32]|uniref:Uncharacterized protein n=1 Tax=Fulvimarina uroteuthidis TaxID=3098149 RepID=A0ABU5HZG1_9HYPH|nr:hypothetical protein [Fulvimarina sp. 2208YS6-2-32]MDY8108252.1 hypothetical protein [Fulvimarina sp. 2208YS6-2-32]
MDLARLQFAVEVMSETDAREWRQRYRIGGFKVDEPRHIPETVEEFNDQARETMRAMMRGFKKPA